MAMIGTAAAATPVESSISHQGDVVMNNFHVLHSKREPELSTFQVPRSLSLSVASDNCCSCLVYPNKAKTVEVSAFIPSNNTQSVGLYCDGIFVHRFSFQNDTILCVKLLPMPPSSTSNDDAHGIEHTLASGTIVIIATLNKGLVIYTVVLEEDKDSGAFLPIKYREIATCEREHKVTGRRIRSMTATVVSNDKDKRPSLLVALYSSPEGQPLVDQNVDVERYSIPNHTCPIFQFTSGSPLEAVRSEKDNVTIKVVGRVSGMTFGSVSSSSGFISLAIMTSTQLTLLQISLSKSTLSLLHSANLLLNGCHSSHNAGTASMVVSLGGSVQGVNSESFAIVYKPKSSDIAYTSASETKRPIDSPNVFHQEAVAITTTNKSSSFFSPTLKEIVEDNEKLIEESISATILATVKDHQKPHLDKSLRIEEETSKVITPEGKIRDSKEKGAATSTESNRQAVDASKSVLSPLMGLTLADGERTRDESPLMTSLLNIQTPIIGQAPTSMGTTHMVLACVEYVGHDYKIKLSPYPMSFPQEMGNLQVLAVLPVPESENDCTLMSPAARGHFAFDDLMFSPSPGKLMGTSSCVKFPNKLSVICRSAGSKLLHCFILATRDNKHLVVESDKCIDLDSILSQSCKLSVKALKIKGVNLVGMSVSSEGGRVVCCDKIRIVASGTYESTVEAETPNAINLSLYEDGSVHIFDVSCFLPLGEDRSIVPVETHPADMRLISAYKNETGTENVLKAILDKLSSFEAQVYRRMDAMEAAIRENTDRIEELETTLMKGHDQASF